MDVGKLLNNIVPVSASGDIAVLLLEKREKQFQKFYEFPRDLVKTDSPNLKFSGLYNRGGRHWEVQVIARKGEFISSILHVRSYIC